MRRSVLEVNFSLSRRVLSRSRVEDMTIGEEDFARKTNDVLESPKTVERHSAPIPSCEHIFPGMKGPCR